MSQEAQLLDDLVSPGIKRSLRKHSPYPCLGCSPLAYPSGHLQKVNNVWVQLQENNTLQPDSASNGERLVNMLESIR